jgi:NAD(P)-dependent dehydrogenase (short-subunit alcohol dehydrogenase family)
MAKNPNLWDYMDHPMERKEKPMSHPILVTGAAGGRQGSTGRVITNLLLEQGIPVRALVHKLDSRSDALRQQGAEVVEGDLLNSASVQAAMRDVKRAYFTYPVADGLLEAATIFAAAARDAALELVVNNSQYQGRPDDPAFRDLKHAASFRNLQHRLADRIFDWAQVNAVHVQAPPYYENVRALVGRSVAGQSTVFLPWGADTQTVYPLVGETPTVRAITEALGRAIARPIRYVAISEEQWADAVKERLGPHALDHLSHLWQNFRKGEERYQKTDAIRAVTGRTPQTLEEFFRENAGFFAGRTEEA